MSYPLLPPSPTTTFPISMQNNQSAKWVKYTRTPLSTRMHSSRMRTVRNSSRLLLGGLHTPWEQTPQNRHPLGAGTRQEQAPPCCKACWDSTPLLRGMLGYHLQCILGYHTPLQGMLANHLQSMLGYHPHCKACWDTTCNACWDIPPVNRMTDTCKT